MLDVRKDILLAAPEYLGGRGERLGPVAGSGLR